MIFRTPTIILFAWISLCVSASQWPNGPFGYICRHRYKTWPHSLRPNLDRRISRRLRRWSCLLCASQSSWTHSTKISTIRSIDAPVAANYTQFVATNQSKVRVQNVHRFAHNNDDDSNIDASGWLYYAGMWEHSERVWWCCCVLNVLLETIRRSACDCCNMAMVQLHFSIVVRSNTHAHAHIRDEFTVTLQVEHTQRIKIIINKLQLNEINRK